jgi:hypothetical protein
MFGGVNSYVTTTFVNMCVADVSQFLQEGFQRAEVSINGSRNDDHYKRTTFCLEPLVGIPDSYLCFTWHGGARVGRIFYFIFSNLASATVAMQRVNFVP